MLHIHRSRFGEALVETLSSRLQADWPEDPFAPVAISVGSRGMERWLRHELATRHGSAARLAFLFPRRLFETAAQWLIAPQHWNEPSDAFLEGPGIADPWTGRPLVARVLRILRSRMHHDAFAAVRAALGDAVTERPEIGGLELRFAEQVAGVLERLHYDRPADALDWAADPMSAPPEHRWLALLLADLDQDLPRDSAPSPAALLRTLRRVSPPRARLPALHFFGLSTLKPGDKLRIAALAPHVDIHLYLLVPSKEWWGHLLSHRERLRELRAKLEASDVSGLDPQEVLELFSGNDLLAANGAPSREMQSWIEDLPHHDHELPDPADRGDGPDTILRHLQDWIDQAGDNPSPGDWTGVGGRESVELHSCHGALRQCEALRDELLRRLAEDATLEPRHILVMTPDVATYAPLVAAVFGRSATLPDGKKVPALPVHVADLGLRARNTVAEALWRVLHLGGERITASGLLGLLDLWPVRRRFGIEEADLPELRELVSTSGLRWGWDASDRKTHDQPERVQNTVQFGLERLALGVLMPDDDPLGVVSGAPTDEPIAPCEPGSRDRIGLFGRLAELCRALATQVAALRDPAPAPVWRDRLDRALDALTLADDASAWLRVQVNEVLQAELGALAEHTLDRSAVMSLLTEALELPLGGDRPVTGAVTMCAMEPMRSVPFRVIAILGLDDGAFPRVSRTPGWDPFARPRSGEHDRRTLDRHLFLESILSARDALLLFGTGFEPRRGEETPLSIVATELEELLLRTTRVPGRDGAHAQWPRRHHPLQPWSPQNFVGHPPERVRLPYDPVWFEARRRLQSGLSGSNALPGLPSTRPDALWPDDHTPSTSITVQELAAALENAPRVRLQARVGLRLRDDDAEVLDREPLDLESLDKWSLRDRIADILTDDPHTSVLKDGRLARRLRAEGVLPLDAGGGAVLDEADEAIQKVLRKAALEGGRPLQPFDVAVSVAGMTVSTTVRDARPTADGQALVWITPSNDPSEKLQLTAWLTLLVARLKGHPLQRAKLVGVKSTVSMALPVDDDHHGLRQHLEDLLALRRAARTHEVLLFPKLSQKVARQGAQHPDWSPERVAAACEREWEGSDQVRGAKDDVWVAAQYQERGIEELNPAALLDAARKVWGPIVASERPATGAASESEEEDS